MFTFVKTFIFDCLSNLDFIFLKRFKIRLRITKLCEFYKKRKYWSKYIEKTNIKYLYFYIYIFLYFYILIFLYFYIFKFLYWFVLIFLYFSIKSVVYLPTLFTCKYLTNIRLSKQTLIYCHVINGELKLTSSFL